MSMVHVIARRNLQMWKVNEAPIGLAYQIYTLRLNFTSYTKKLKAWNNLISSI